MDFEKEMHESFKVIFHNIKVLETKRKTSVYWNHSKNGVSRQQRKLSAPVNGVSTKFEEQHRSAKGRCFSV